VSEDLHTPEVVNFPIQKSAQDSTGEPAATVTVIDFSKVRSVRRTPSVQRPCCKHFAVTVDTHNREVICRECGATIDPFDYLSGWANREEGEVLAAAELRKDAERLKTEIDTLKRERANEKSKLDRILLAQNKARKEES